MTAEHTPPGPDIEELRRRVSALERTLDTSVSDRAIVSVVDSMFEGVQVLDFELRYLYLNETAARHGHVTRDALVGRRMSEAYPGIEKTEVYRLLERCLAERAPQKMVNHFSYPDGTRAWFDLRIEPVPPGVLVLSVDVSDQRNLADQLHHAQKMETVGRLAGGIAHDFNNLLSVIAGHGELLLRELPEMGPGRKRILEILQAGERAASLTRQLLAFSRKQVLQPVRLDLNAVIARMEPMLRRLIGEDVDLLIELAPDLDAVELDPGKVEQILMNLAVNARDAMPRGGKLVIETANVELDEGYARAHAGATAGPHVMVAMTDTGIGMDAETKARIFEPFFTTKELGRGTGLGLSTVYGSVKQSGGNIWVYSEPGRGTTFKVYVPRAAGPAGPAPRAKERKAPVGGHETVLVVEDEAALRALVRDVLVSAGYTVLEAADGPEALEVAKRHPSDIGLVLTDVVLPKIGGREVAEALVRARPGLKVVYMSGYTDDAIVHHGVLEPGTAFIEKPLTPHVLLEKIRFFLS